MACFTDFRPALLDITDAPTTTAARSKYNIFRTNVKNTLGFSENFSVSSEQQGGGAEQVCKISRCELSCFIRSKRVYISQSRTSLGMSWQCFTVKQSDLVQQFDSHLLDSSELDVETEE